MHIDPQHLSTRHVYQLVTSMIQPRPIAWVGTRSLSGISNLAPFSYFMGVSSDPPALAISIVRKGGGQLKDSAQNILDTHVFTVSIPSVAHIAAVAGSASGYPSDVSEFDALGLDSVQGTVVDAPYPALASATAECRLIHTHDLGTVHLLVGEIVAFHIADSVLTHGRDGQPLVDSAALAPLARLGGVEFAAVGERLVQPTPRVPTS